MKKIDPKVDEAIQTLNMKDGPSRRRLLQGTGLVSAAGAASALLAACSSASNSSGSGTVKITESGAAAVAGNFPKTPAWKFWFVNHATTNEFFTPTKYGYSDAAALLGLPTPNWGGDPNSDYANMINYMQSAISAKADGIALAAISNTAFTSVVSQSMNSGIPVVTYNADGIYKNGVAEIGTNRLAYVGQALYLSGQAMGAQIKTLVPGGGHIVIFIATKGTGNIQPRYDGAVSVLGSSY
ncbi:MAG: substrate-binding domain-containing protein, partial [Trebonia sp.]